MEQIKNFYDGINFVTIPNVLLDELKKISNQVSFSSSMGTDGKMKTTYGEKMEPLFIYFSEYNFYLNDFYYNELFKKIDLEICFDENGIKINRENIKSFFTEYGKGFVRGYNEFESNITKSNSLFTETNEQISYKIYSRIKEHFIYNKNGNFKTPIKNEKVVPNINFTFLFKKKNFFESGFNGGEFYKAWEIILNNPTIFEPIFIKANLENDKTKIETKNPTKIESQYWFIIGLKFATGEMYNLIKEMDNNFTQVAKELGNDSYRPYISETYNNSTESDKNIFSKPKKIKSIYNYCIENNIKMITDFIDAHNLNESK